MSNQRKHVLLQIKAPGSGPRIVVFDTQDLTFGRSAENDLSFDDAEISRRHAIFTRGEGYCVVEDMGTSNGTMVNGQVAARQQLSPGDVVQVGEIQLIYHETSKNPATLAAKALVEYGSQLKSFGSGPVPDGEATMLGLVNNMAGNTDDAFEVQPAGDFDFNSIDAPPAARDLDVELEGMEDPADGFDNLGFENASTAAAAPRTPATTAKTEVWDLEDDDAVDPPAASRAGPLSLHLEIEGLSPDLRRALEQLLGKTIDLPQMRIRLKSDDLG